MRLTTASLALLALVALCQLAAVPAVARGLNGGSRRALLQIREEEKKQLEAQVAAQERQNAEGMALVQQQVAEQALKGQEAGIKQAAREAKQLADQERERAENAERDNAVEEQQQALEESARKAEKKARNEAKKVEKELEKVWKEAQKEVERLAQEGNSSDEEDRKSDDEVADASQSSSSSRSSTSSSSSSSGGDNSPIWGLEQGDGGGGPVSRATYHYYAPLYETSSLYCADQFNKFLPVGPDHWLLQHPWTAYCNDDGLGPMSQDKCGKCLKVTNTATGESVKTRVVDLCGTGGVDMDPLGFNAIDGNGAGKRDGNMMVRLEWC